MRPSRTEIAPMAPPTLVTHMSPQVANLVVIGADPCSELSVLTSVRAWERGLLD